jgi:hypothetical protein
MEKTDQNQTNVPSLTPWPSWRAPRSQKILWSFADTCRALGISRSTGERLSRLPVGAFPRPLRIGIRRFHRPEDWPIRLRRPDGHEQEDREAARGLKPQLTCQNPQPRHPIC